MFPPYFSKSPDQDKDDKGRTKEDLKIKRNERSNEKNNNIHITHVFSTSFEHVETMLL